MTKNDYEKLKLQRRKAQINGKIEAQFLQDAGFDDAINAAYNKILCEPTIPRSVCDSDGCHVSSDKKIIDVCCGSKMFWFDKHNPNVEFCDNRSVERHEFYPNRYIEICPDTICDFTELPFSNGEFKLVVFDPPHLIHAGAKSWLAIKYGRLEGDWREMLRKGFSECFRILENDGILIFKWSEVEIPLKEILALTHQNPLFGHRSGKNMNTHWICFMKQEDTHE